MFVNSSLYINKIVLNCVFRKTLRTLFADGWGCVPNLLVVWQVASKHWSLQCWVGLGFGEKMAASKRADSKEYSPELPPPVSLSP